MIKRAPWVDVVFGTHNLHGLPKLLNRARETNQAQVEILPRLVEFPSNLSASRQSKHSAWVSISMGCNNTCTFCIVPSLRGKERDRRPQEILAEVEQVVSQGAKEVTLLGQNVNSYGVEFGERGAFAKLLRAMGQFEKDGLKRVRFTSPHPAAFTEDVILAMKETSNIMPTIHMPLQSGSDKVLREMRRSYNSSRFLDILDLVRKHIPHIAITTDIIVGFPGESEQDFEETLEVVRKAKFSSAYTFQYSVRPGTPAGSREDQVPKEVVQNRFDRLLDLQNTITLEIQKSFEGKTVEVMVANRQGRKDLQDHRVSGYTRDGRLVHISAPAKSADLTSTSTLPGQDLLPGQFVQVKIFHAAPFHLVGDVV
jgi:tRNA-2-methylthio-N6-dimethylallyladenosine synthase